MKKVIINGEMGSSWQFKRFEKIALIVTDVKQVRSLLAS